MFEPSDPRDKADYTRGALAEFTSEAALIVAVEALSARGYTNLDTLTPRPIEAVQELLAPVRSSLPRYVFMGGLAGAVAALAVEWYCNAWDYPINVGGRPPFSLPAFIPIVFEIMVLCASLTAFFGVMLKMHLPRLAAPVFEAPGIEGASVDRFWVLVSADDPRFDPEQLSATLHELGAEQVAVVPEPRVPPVAPPPPEPVEAES